MGAPPSCQSVFALITMERIIRSGPDYYRITRQLGEKLEPGTD